jgi:ribosomal protein L3 glutamine methyltransferase
MNLPQELETLRDWLRFAVSRFTHAGLFFGHGSANAYDEAVCLLLHALHLPLDRLEPFLDAKLTASERGELAALTTRRIDERVPAAYLTREAWLGSFRFYVDERVLIPRSFIAELLPEGFAAYIRDPDSIKSALDLCTGSGCLAILAALRFPAAKVDAADISEDALAVARRNVADYGLGERVQLVRSDLFGALAGRRYDLIVSNPPYVKASSMRCLPAEYRKEPALALASGADGLEHARAILGEARAHLEPGGLLVVEIGHNRRALEKSFPDLELAWPRTRGGKGYLFTISREGLHRAGA